MAEAGDRGGPPPPEGPRERPGSLPGRLFGTGARGARRVAGAAGIDRAVELATEEALVRALESPAVERALVRVLESEAFEHSMDEALGSPAVERALRRALDSTLVDHLWAQLLASEEAQMLVERIAKAPEVRAAMAAQSVGLLEDLGRQIRRGTRRLDLTVERVARRISMRRRRTESPPQAGLISRAVGVLIDLGFLNGGFFIVSGLVALLLGLLAPHANSDAKAPLAAIGGGFWLVAASAYLVAFWALAGETPGMRFAGLQLRADGARRIGLRRAVRRLVGTGLSVLTLGIGFLGVLFSERRRSLADLLADTEVLYVASASPTPPWSSGGRAGAPAGDSAD